MRVTYTRERRLAPARVAGVDEVGRGPWAGPVIAAAVVLDPKRIPRGLKDSKALPAAKRALLAAQIAAKADVGIGMAVVAEIDTCNILQASYLAMLRALAALRSPPEFALVDGKWLPPDLPCPGEAVIAGDGSCASIAAASIVAKEHRDAIMRRLAKRHPGFGWETNMGYGTAAHHVGLLCHGVTPHHRRSFKPIHNMLCTCKNLTY